MIALCLFGLLKPLFARCEKKIQKEMNRPLDLRRLALQVEMP